MIRFGKILSIAVLAIAAFIVVAEDNFKLTPKADMSCPSVNRRGESYRIIMFGDLHYDGEQYHHFLEEKWKKIIKAIPRNIEMWESRMGRLLDAAVAKKTPETTMIIQTGDLVEGNCGKCEVQTQMIQDGIKVMRDKFGNVPFLFCAGNHDYNGRDAQIAFDKAALPYYSEVLGRKIEGRTFYLKIKDDLYIFTDYNRPDLELIEKALKENSDARYKFLVTHGSVLPSDLPQLHGYFLSNDNAKYKYMRNLFLQNELIVLSGHSHVTEFIDCVAEEGRLTQLILDSRWTPADVIEKGFSSTKAEQYGRRQKTPETKAVYNEYKGTIKEFKQIFTAGYYVLDITPDGITVNLFVGDKTQSIYNYKIR